MVWALAQLQPGRPSPRSWAERMLTAGAETAAALAAEAAATRPAGTEGWGSSAPAYEFEAGAEGPGDGSLRPRHVAMLLLALARLRLARTRKGRAGAGVTLCLVAGCCSSELAGSPVCLFFTYHAPGLV